MSLREKLLEIERRFWEAAGDPGFYQEHFATDGLMALPVGVLTKNDVIAAMEGGERWADFTIDDPHLVELSDEVAALVYSTEAFGSPSSPESYRALITSVYVNRGGDWILTLHQQTPV